VASTARILGRLASSSSSSSLCEREGRENLEEEQQVEIEGSYPHDITERGRMRE